MTLEPIDPETAVELYLADRKNDVADATLYSHEKRLDYFIRWCEENDIENLNALTGRKLQRYRIWRRNEGNLSTASEKTQIDTLRVFIRWLESIDGVEPDLSEKVVSPSLSAEDNTRDVMLESERATEVLTYLEKYAYGTIDHVTIALMWHTMMRIGAVYALDVDDFYADDQYLAINHRPETGTPIKNQERGERLVALSDQLCDLLTDWITDQRPSITDEYGREPLLVTPEGRVHKTTLRNYVYRYTRPCVYGDSCPHDREQEDCDATEYHAASQCPSSVSPHAIRRGSITYALNSEMPEKAVGDRANVSQEILEQHYDRRSEREKMEQRREYLSNL